MKDTNQLKPISLTTLNTNKIGNILLIFFFFELQQFNAMQVDMRNFEGAPDFPVSGP